MARLLSFIFFAFIFSCTIIEDGDITSQEELDGLKLISIDIETEASVGSGTSTARVTSEAAVSIVVPGGTIKKQIWMDWPALGVNSKLKVKSGTTTAFKSYTSLLESGKPWTFYLFTSTSTDTTVIEQYSFRYNSSGRLSNIISRVPYVLNGPATSNDTLIYDTNGRLSSITRKYPATGTTAALSNFEYRTGDDDKLIQFIFQGMNYQVPCKGNGCNSYWGGNYHVAPGTNTHSNNFPTGVMNLASTKKAYLSIEDFNDLSQYCNQNCSAWIDTFYLHPLMMLKDQLPTGDDLLFIYMVDWWQPSTVLPTTSNEKVIFTFNYDF